MAKSVLMLPWARTRKRRFKSDVSSRFPVNKPRTAISNRSRAMAVRIPERSIHQATERESHSAARFAVHGASIGTRLEDQSILACAKAIVATASGLIFGMRPR